MTVTYLIMLMVTYYGNDMAVTYMTLPFSTATYLTVTYMTVTYDHLDDT